MVADHLDDTHESITDEIESVPKTNVVREILPNLTGCFDNASTLTLEAMTLFANNKAVNWLKPKTETEMADLLRTTRTKAPEFQKLFQHCWKLMLEERAKIQTAK